MAPEAFWHMSDKERIMALILNHFAKPWGSRWRKDSGLPGMATICEYHPRRGDLVRLTFMRDPLPFTLSWFVEGNVNDKFVVREIGSERTLEVSNASLVTVKGLPRYLLLEGHQHKAYVKVRKAIRALVREFTRFDAPLFSDLLFPDRHSRHAALHLRPHVFSGPPTGQWVTPILVPLYHLTSRTTIRELKATITEHAPPGEIDWRSRFGPKPEGYASWVAPPWLARPETPAEAEK
jgi:hypothetical protein